MNRYLAVPLIIILLVAEAANSTPMRDDGNKGVIRWPKNTTITVYIPVDPDGQNRHLKVAEGIKEWNNQSNLQNQGISITVQTGNPPPNATNAVSVQWSSSLVGPNNNRYGEASTSYVTNGGNTIDGGTIKLSRDTNQVTDQMAKNLGIHEMGHILGLDDVKSDGTPDYGTAMDPDFTKAGALQIGSSDSSELGSVYAANATDTNTNVQATVTPTAGYYEYSYALEWISGSELAMFQVDTNGAAIFDIIAPSGWTVGPEMGLGYDNLLISDGVTQDLEAITGYEIGDPFISFVLTDEISYLGPSNTNLTFGFSSYNNSVEGEAFLNGDVLTQVPSVPTPQSLALMLLGLGCLAWSTSNAKKGSII